MTDSIEEYTIKSCYKIGKCFSPGCVPIFSPRSKIPGLLLFGGKFQFEKKDRVKMMNKNYLMYPQDQDRCKQLSHKYDVGGCKLSLEVLNPDILDKKKKVKEPIKSDIFNGDIE